MTLLSKIRTTSVSIPWALAVITIVLYLPFYFHIVSLSYEQSRSIAFKDSPLYVLPVYENDSSGYVTLSENIINHRLFSASVSAPYYPNTFRTPIFPVALAIFKEMLGSYTFFPLLQILVVILTSILIFKIGNKIYSEKAGLLAAVFFIVDPTTIYHAMIILSENLYVFFLLLAFYLMFFSDMEDGYRLNFLRGFALGFATLIRPISMYLLFVFVPAYIFLRKDLTSKKKIVFSILFIIFGYTVVTLPWMIRNKMVADSWQLSSAKDFNFFLAYVPEYLSFRDKIDINVAKKKMLSDLGRPLSGDGQSLSDASDMRRVYLKYLYEDPIGYLSFHSFKTIPFFFASGIKSVYLFYDHVLGFDVFDLKSTNLSSLLLRGKIAEVVRDITSSPLIFGEQLFWIFVYLFSIIARLVVVISFTRWSSF
ncbi:MAG: glycosyltransferase family 39 protein [Candidatus Vogelbacteria bacterium]|nr:glycosyltransferase family 39 protein [Candidatus Vogelbacteria bacterium]